METAIQPASQAERKAPNMLQLIRTRFTSGRPRKWPLDMLGPMFVTGVASNERDRITEFIRAQDGDPADFVIQVFVVTARRVSDSLRGKAHLLPEDKKILDLADTLKAAEGVMYPGILVSVTDSNGAVLRYMRTFAVSLELNEVLARVALQVRYGKEGA